MRTYSPHGHWKADNLSNHKAAGEKEAIEAAGATIRYLPPYSPDLKSCFQNSRQCSERLLCAQSTHFGMKPVDLSIRFLSTNAKTTSARLDMCRTRDSP